METMTKSDLTMDNILDNIRYEDYPECFRLTKKDRKKINQCKVLGKKNFIHFVGNSDLTFLVPDDLPFVLWHKVTSHEEMKDITDFYLKLTVSADVTSECIFRGFIGLAETTHLTFSALEKFILLHPLTEKIIWGPLYRKPETQFFSKLNPLDMAINIAKLSEQSNNLNSKEINFVTKYSKSVISFIEVDESFFIQIKYVPMTKESKEIKHINKLLGFQFNEKLPHDVISILSVFPKILTHTDLLKLNPPQVTLSLIVASNIPEYLEEIIVLLNELYNKKDSLPDLIALDVYDALLSLTINKEFDKVYDKTIIVNEENISRISEEIEQKCTYNKKFHKENVIKYIEYLLRKLFKFDF